MPTTIEDLKADFEAKVLKLQNETRVAQNLPEEFRGFVCSHSKFFSTSAEVKTLAEALALKAKFPLIVECEAWKDGCVSTWPVEINSYANSERAELQFVSHAHFEMNSYGSRGEYRDCKLRFWTRLGPDLIQISVKILARPASWHVASKTNYDAHGNITGYTNIPPNIGEDNRTRYWSPAPCYNFQFHWADVHNFDASMSHELSRVK